MMSITIYYNDETSITKGFYAKCEGINIKDEHWSSIVTASLFFPIYFFLVCQTLGHLIVIRSGKLLKA